MQLSCGQFVTIFYQPRHVFVLEGRSQAVFVFLLLHETASPGDKDVVQTLFGSRASCGSYPGAVWGYYFHTQGVKMFLFKSSGERMRTKIQSFARKALSIILLLSVFLLGVGSLSLAHAQAGSSGIDPIRMAVLAG